MPVTLEEQIGASIHMVYEAVAHLPPELQFRTLAAALGGAIGQQPTKAARVTAFTLAMNSLDQARGA